MESGNGWRAAALGTSTVSAHPLPAAFKVTHTLRILYPHITTTVISTKTSISLNTATISPTNHNSGMTSFSQISPPASKRSLDDDDSQNSTPTKRRRLHTLKYKPRWGADPANHMQDASLFEGQLARSVAVILDRVGFDAVSQPAFEEILGQTQECNSVRAYPTRFTEANVGQSHARLCRNRPTIHGDQQTLQPAPPRLHRCPHNT
jgi:hypothetical protein